jgi:hypothetical protein
MKKRAALAVAIAAAALFAAGCGNGYMTPYVIQYGDVEGYIYADSYNSGLAARPALRAAGRAVPDGQVPVSGAQVSLTAKGFTPAQAPVPVQTDGDGKFVFSDVEAGLYTLKAVKNGMAHIEFDVTVVAHTTNVVNDSAGDNQMSMTPTDTGTLTVTAVADCQVSIPVEGDVYVGGLLTTYKTPVAVINDIAPGLREILVRADGYQVPAAKNVTIASGAQQRVDFILVPSGGNMKPLATISTPANGANVYQGNIVTFTGVGVDCEDGNLSGASLVWTSDIDGQIGTGALVTSNTLSLGTHAITLEVSDEEGLKDTDTITLVVNPAQATAPVATIISPINGYAFAVGAVVTFIGTGLDAQDGVLTGTSLRWHSNKDGNLGTGTYLTKSNLSENVHIITLTATDSNNESDTATVTITVGETEAENQPPVVAIASPVSGSSVASGSMVFFAGGAVDPEDGAITGAGLVWTSDIDGALETGAYFTKNNLTPGLHTITLSVEDSQGEEGSDSVTIEIRE